jgi:nitrite reductase/ring-hydroxylating ferredoxin subunit
MEELIMPEFVRVAAENEIAPGTSREVELQGRVVALFNVAGKLCAIDGICPHAGGPLGEGTLEGTVVTCPWHGWQFDVTTGRSPRNPACVQRSYEVKVEGGEILVAVP